MNNQRLGRVVRRSALTVALGVCFASGVQAQSTTGTIYGNVPAGEATTITVQNESGFSRSVPVESSGRYNIGNLPIGNYTVTLQQGGQTVDTRRNVTIRVGAGTDVSFAGATASAGGGDATTLGTITVTAASVPPIDVTSVDTRTVITAEELERLPTRRSAEAIALLSPGAVSGAAGFGALRGLVSFGGSGVSENAYYINGYFSGEPVSNLGGTGLPYNAIDQQETYTGGYSARYGRSDGGVISQIGKRGTNEAHFGGQVTWSPKQWREDREAVYYPDIDFSEVNANPNLPVQCDANPDPEIEELVLCQWGYEDESLPGTLARRADRQEVTRTTVSAYAGGPLVRDKLFAFVAMEADITNQRDHPDTQASTQWTTKSRFYDPSYYAKLDWNITDNHLLEYSFISDSSNQRGYYYDFDQDTGEMGARQAAQPTPVKRTSKYNVLNYRGFLTDNLTLSANYGRGKFTNKQVPVLIPDIPFIAGASSQDPAITGGTFIPNQQGGWQGIDSENETEGLRIDLEWVVGDHTLTAGIDNIEFEAMNEGTSQVAQRWDYSKANDPSAPISPGLGVGAPGGNGYYVNELRFFTNTSMTVEQNAWYIEDRWNVTDNLLLSLGIRNDEFINKNNVGAAYMDAKDQWAPRIGASWDVFGDSSLKLFANAGRYFLAMPNNVAIRGASASTFTREYFTYTGIDPNGMPTGLTPVPGVDGGPSPGPVSSNGEYGEPVDVLAFAPSDLENMYQDEYILGFEKAFGQRWSTGAKLTYRDLKSSIDDICDPYTFMDVLGAVNAVGQGSGYNAELADGSHVFVNYCYMFNPGATNTFSLAELDAAGNPTGTRRDVQMSATDWGFNEGLKRTYQAVDLFLQRQFDGVWEARLDYTYSKSEGNNEGQVKSEFGQTNISKTQDWDAWQMMRFADGYLANDRRHQLKLRGSYQIAPEWLVSGTFRLQSGTPISCLGLYNPDGSIYEGSTEADPISYGSSYHTCLGQVAEPGKERTPWTRQLDLGVTYRPNFADGHLALGLQVFNALNDQKPLQVDVTSENDAYTISNTYLMPIGFQTPRYFMLTASLDF